MTKSVLILCTGNSCRSQMAEYLWNRIGGERWTAHSAGSKPAGYVHPLAMKVMDELGEDLANARSKSIEEFRDRPLDLVVTVCDPARESCPVLSGVQQTLHWPFFDPAEAIGTEEQKIAVFREVRDQIESKIREFLRPVH